ncbi:YgiQ family radical SAM protein [candidate division KSB1 bacterium]|nr:YgiQ family radical SAM protein [candidate division KSB1 bacterium]
MWLPTTPQELVQLGWSELDVILVSGDTYIDSPFIGVALIGRLLHRAGFRVGIIAQPTLDSPVDITRLGAPRLFWGVSGGSVDSMIANYTAVRKFRNTDDYTPGGVNNRRPDRAVITYVNLIRRYFKNTCPIVLGGIEASLRRVAHYDYWSNRLRKSILFDAKADFLLYGMAERSVLEFAAKLRDGEAVTEIRGLCYLATEKPADFLELPDFDTVAADQKQFIEMFHQFYQLNDPLTARGWCQRHDARYLIHNPPALYPTTAELDAYYDLDFTREVHPFYQPQGVVRAQDTIKFALTTHQGCYGECNFCAIAVHQGRTVRWRSESSILKEAQKLISGPDFKGYIQDVGGPTANMYGFECALKLKRGSCLKKRCIHPEICGHLIIDHSRQLQLLRKLRQLPGVKKVFVASGLRYDLILADSKAGAAYLKNLVQEHVSGQLKIAPEHTEKQVLQLMGKPGPDSLLTFKAEFDRLSRAAGKSQFLTYYFIAAYPGCTDADMLRLKQFTRQRLQINPEQVQIFVPAPCTYASVMYYTEMDPFTGRKIYVVKDNGRKQRQKQILIEKRSKKSR